MVRLPQRWPDQFVIVL